MLNIGIFLRRKFVQSLPQNFIYFVVGSTIITYHELPYHDIFTNGYDETLTLKTMKFRGLRDGFLFLQQLLKTLVT